LIWLLSLIQSLTLVVVIIANLPLAVRFLLMLTLLLQVISSQWLLRGLTRDRIIRLQIDHEHISRLTLLDGREVKTRLHGDSLITPWLILLRFEGERYQRHHRLLLGRDSLSEQELRRLRIMLRFGGASFQASKPNV
jgi:hypothetical protein